MINANLHFKPIFGAVHNGAELVLAARIVPGRAS